MIERKKIWFALTILTILLQLFLVNAVLPTPVPNLGVPVSFIKASCPTNVVTTAVVDVKVVHYVSGVLTCKPITPGVSLSVTVPSGTSGSAGNPVCTGDVYVYSVSSTENGVYQVTASSGVLPDSKCSFTASHQKETPVPELSEWSLLAVVLSVFGLLGRFSRGGLKKKRR